jgi:hypothetical protein
MIKHLLVPAVLAGFLLAPSVAGAQNGKAPCGSFKKLPDGKWSVAKTIKIEHLKDSAVLNPGTIITPGMQVAGVNIYEALQKSCH